MKKFTFLFATLFVVMSAFAEYYVAGSPSLCGSNWSNNDANNKMTLTNGVYVKSYANVPAGSHEFKITNGTWDNAKGAWCVDASTSTPGYTGEDNISFTLLNATNITISYNESTDKITLKAEGIDRFGTFTISSYTLCGNFPCFNGEWAPANSANDMTKDDNGIWTKTYENITLSAQTYEYKVAANHNWGQGEFPTQGNYQYEIKETGSYNITFTYNPAKLDLSCNATKVGASQATVYPVGTSIYVTVHSQWTADDARFAAYFFGSGEKWENMTQVESSIYSVVVPAGEWTGMIICRMNPNNTENNWSSEGENAPYWGAQTTDVTYEEGKNHYIINSEDQTWDGNKPGGHWSTYGDNPGNNNQDNNDPEKPQPEANVYTLCGDSIIFGTSWNETDTLNDMTRGEDGIWVKEYSEVTLTKGTYEYKVVASHNWETPGKYPSDDTNMTLYIAKDGIYDLKFTFNPTIPELKAVATIKVNIENITINNIYAINGYVHADTDITIYTITGQDVTSQNGNLTQGVYIIKTQNATSKLIIK